MTEHNGFPILQPEEAAELVANGMTLGIGGFTDPGCPHGEPFAVRVLSGAEAGPAVDQEMAGAGAICFRMPYQAEKLETPSNAGTIEYVDAHLSHVAQQLTQGIYGHIDLAIVEATQVSRNGRVSFSTAIGNAPAILNGPAHGVVAVLHVHGGVSGFVRRSDARWSIGRRQFHGPDALRGQVAGSVRRLEVFLSAHCPAALRAIQPPPTVIRQLGVISVNTALEADIYGHVNSTHVCGTQMMNGIGGSGDFERNGYLTLFVAPSVAKNGAISTIVPFCSHIDHSEHSVHVLVTEHGLADLRGIGPAERVRRIIDHCAHPAYRDYLDEYVRRSHAGHNRHDLTHCFELHRKPDRLWSNAAWIESRRICVNPSPAWVGGTHGKPRKDTRDLTTCYRVN